MRIVEPTNFILGKTQNIRNYPDKREQNNKKETKENTKKGWKMSSTEYCFRHKRQENRDLENERQERKVHS